MSNIRDEQPGGAVQDQQFGEWIEGHIDNTVQVVRHEYQQAPPRVKVTLKKGARPDVYSWEIETEARDLGERVEYLSDSTVREAVDAAMIADRYLRQRLADLGLKVSAD